MSLHRVRASSEVEMEMVQSLMGVSGELLALDGVEIVSMNVVPVKSGSGVGESLVAQ